MERILSAALVVVALIGIACQGAGKGNGSTQAGRAAEGAAVPASTSQSAKAPAVVVKKDNPCSVLLPGEVEQILGTPITMREVMDEVTCHFNYDKPAPGGPPFLEIKVYFEDGRTAITATRMAAKLLGGDSGFEKLSGIGDEAWLGPMASTLVFLKGSAGVEIDLRLVPDGRDKGIRLAKLIVQRL